MFSFHEFHVTFNALPLISKTFTVMLSGGASTKYEVMLLGFGFAGFAVAAGTGGGGSGTLSGNGRAFGGGCLIMFMGIPLWRNDPSEAGSVVTGLTGIGLCCSR